jgi:hypothetical protein
MLYCEFSIFKRKLILRKLQIREVKYLKKIE